MKNVILIAMLAFLSVNAFAQEKEEKKVNAPALVAKAFQKDFPKVTKVSWVAEGNDFEAEFKLNGVEASANYDKTGKKLETELEIKKESLPAGALSYIKKNFSTSKLSEAAKITDAKNVVTYEAVISKGGKNTELVFDAAGGFLKKE